MHLLPFSFRSKKWYTVALKIVFYASNIIAFILALIDIEYFQYNYKRLTIDIWFIVDEGQGMFWQYIKDFWEYIPIFIILLFFIEILYPKSEKSENKDKVSYLNQGIILLSGLLLFFLLARGSLGKNSLSPAMASRYACPLKIPIVTNTPFTFIYSIFHRHLEEKKYFGSNEVDKNFTLIRNSKYSTKPRHENVVIIIIESCSMEFIGSLNHYKGYTPFLDSLVSQSLVFDRAVANAERSNKGIACVLTGMPSLMDEAIACSLYKKNNLTGIGTYLKDQGYYTSFFHGGTNGTMNFVEFTKEEGLDNYYGRTEFNNEKYFDGHWGIYDEDFFQFFAKKLNEFPQPFFSTIFSLSSHHPYKIPAKYKGKFPKGCCEITESLGYTDFALRNFFDTISKNSWFKNTLFIITGDHPFKIGTHFLPDYKLSARKYSVPILFYKPGEIQHKISHHIVQQIDIMPSVLDYLGYPEPFYSFGHSVFTDTSDCYGYQCRNQIYQIYNSKYILYFDGSKSIGLYNYVKDTLEKENLVFKENFVRTKLENTIKAIIQQHNHVLLVDHLTKN